MNVIYGIRDWKPLRGLDCDNAYDIDPELAGTLLEGDLTIEFSAEERLQPITYRLGLIVVRSIQEIEGN
jgi:hypothetical protein